jgi:acetyl esterase/lipase
MDNQYSFLEKQFGGSSEALSSASTFLRMRAGFNQLTKIQHDYVNGMFKSKILRDVVGGVNTDIVLPANEVDPKRFSRALIHLCGGVHYLGEDMVHTAVVVANYSGIPVFIPRYRHYPKYSNSEQREDVFGVYKACAMRYGPKNLGVFGECSSALITAALVRYVLEEDLPTPGALALLGIMADPGDSEHLNKFLDFISLQFIILNSRMESGKANKAVEKQEVGTETVVKIDPKGEPTYVFPYDNFPPTMLLTGTRDQSMSGTVRFHQRLIEAGCESELHVYEGMAHAHHTKYYLEEARESLADMVNFFERHIGK